MNSPYYMETMKALETGEYLSIRQMLADLSETQIWFDTEHATNEIQRAYNETHTTTHR